MEVSQKMYVKLNEHIEYGSEILYLIMVKISAPGCVVPHLLLTIVNYFIFDLDDESYVLPFPVMYVPRQQFIFFHAWHWLTVKDKFRLFSRLPFNWTTPFGYLVAYSILCVTVFCSYYCTYLVTCFLIGICWLSIKCVEDITNDLRALSFSKGTKDSHQKLKRSLINIVQMHSDVKQLSLLIQFYCLDAMSLTRAIAIFFRSKI